MISKELIHLSIFASIGDSSGLKRLIESATFKRLNPIKIVETCLEIHLFAGFPAAIEAFIALRPHLRVRKLVGQRDVPGREERGKRLLKEVYARNYENLMKNMNSLHPDLALWIVDYGYGRVLSRKGLSLVERELVAVASLAALGWKRQLHSHLLGALNAGASIRELQLAWSVIRKTPLGPPFAALQPVFAKALKEHKMSKKA